MSNPGTLPAVLPFELGKVAPALQPWHTDGKTVYTADGRVVGVMLTKVIAEQIATAHNESL